MSKTKVYTITHKNAGQLHTTYCGCPVTLNFRNGFGADGRQTASLITSEPFIQDAIEHDERFGTLIRLARTFDNEVTARNEMQQERTFTVESARQKAIEEAQAAQAQKDADDEAKKEAIRAKRRKAKAAKEVKETTEKESTVFESINEAMRFFLDKGMEVTEDNLPALLEEYGASIKSE